MEKLCVVLVGALVLAAGCASAKLSPENTTIVMAKSAERGKGTAGVSETFNFEGQIVAYLTFRWQPVDQEGGEQRIEVRWFNEDREISRRTHQAIFGRPPHYVWFHSSGSALGVGKCRVDAYANGNYVGSKSFTVTDK